MGKPITMVNKMAESVLTRKPQNASSLTQALYWSLLQDKFATSCKSRVRAEFSKTGDATATLSVFSSQRHRDD